jgi:hypothetical protein
VAKFDVEYDDFSGGHFIGGLETQQPRSSWTGENVTITADEGFLMADPGWVQHPSGPAPGVVQSTPILDEKRRSVVVSIGNKLTFWDLGPFPALVQRTMTPAPAAYPASAPLLRTNVAGIDYYAYSVGGTLVLLGQTGATTSSTLITGGVMAEGLWQWGAFTVSWGANNVFSLGALPPRNRLYFSNAGAVGTVWPANNFVDIGPPWSPILGVVATADVLYVATTNGWYAVSGVLGQTTTVRKVSRIAMDDDAQFSGWFFGYDAIETQQGIFHRSGTGDVIRTLGGSTVSPVMYLSGARSMHRISNAGDHIVGLEAAGDFTYGGSAAVTHAWVRSETSQAWRRTLLPTPTQLGSSTATYFPVIDDATQTDSLYCVVQAGTGGSATTYNFELAKNPLQPAVVGGVFTSATVTLADYQKTRPFRVREMLVEVDFGQPTNQATQRSLTAQVLASPVLDMDPTFARTTSGDVSLASSSAQTVTWGNAIATKNGDRQLLRFNVNDGPASTFSVSPRLTLKGVKVRRVVLHCEDI